MSDEHLSDPGENDIPPSRRVTSKQNGRQQCLKLEKYLVPGEWASLRRNATVSGCATIIGNVMWRLGLKYPCENTKRRAVIVCELQLATSLFATCTARCILLIPLSLWRARARFTQLHVIRVASYSSHSPGLHDMILTRFPSQIGVGSSVSICSDVNHYVDNVLSLCVVPSGWSNIRLRSVGEACMLIAHHVHVRRVSVGRYHQHDRWQE